MGRNTSGVYSLPAGTLVSSGQTILTSQHNPAMTDLAAEMTRSLSRDGYGGMDADLDMGGHDIVSLGSIEPSDLTVSGDGSFGGNLSVTGNGTYGGTLGVTGLSTLASLAVTNNATVGGTLGATGAVTFSSTLEAVGNVSGQKFHIRNQATSDEGLVGFSNTNGPCVIFSGSATASAGLMEFRTAGTKRFEISAAGVSTFSGNVVLKDQASFSGLSNFLLSTNSGTPIVQWDSGDYISYDRSGNIFGVYIGSSLRFKVEASGPQDANGNELGYKDLPQNPQTGGYTLALTDRGKHLYLTSGSATITIPPNSSVAFPVGTGIVIINNGSASKTLARGSGVVLYLAGTQTDAGRTLGQGSVATLIKVATDTWFVSGAGVS